MARPPRTVFYFRRLSGTDRSRRDPAHADRYPRGDTRSAVRYPAVRSVSLLWEVVSSCIDPGGGSVTVYICPVCAALPTWPGLSGSGSCTGTNSIDLSWTRASYLRILPRPTSVVKQGGMIIMDFISVLDPL